MQQVVVAWQRMLDEVEIAGPRGFASSNTGGEGHVGWHTRVVHGTALRRLGRALDGFGEAALRIRIV